MERLKGKTWAGGVIDVAAALRGIKDMAAKGGKASAVFSAVMAGGMLLAAGGMVMPAHGDPTGSMPGAAGSAILVPIVLICLIGCLQCRDKLRNVALATSAGPGSDGTPATEEAPAATAETPLAAYGFVDARGWGWTLVVVGLALLLFALYHGTKIIRGTMLSLTVGLFWLIQSQQSLGRYACILYRDHLECVYSPWKVDLVSIPYARIREARYSRYRLRLLLASGDRTTKFNVYFTLLASDKRDEARAVLRDKMRELGVLREK